MTWTVASIIVGLLLAGFVSPAAAQTAANVLVVINDASAESREIGEYYAQRRNIPAEQVVHVDAPVTDQIDRATYLTKIEAPVIAWFVKHNGWDRILYVVLTKGVPLRIAGTTGQQGTIASVDSELTMLYRKMLGYPTPLPGPLKNPYFVEAMPAGGVTPFTHEKYQIYLVTRLDAFTVAQAKALVDRALAPSRDGQIILDGRIELGSKTAGNTWLQEAATALGKINGFRDRVTLDTGGKRAGKGATNVLGYYSWGSNDIVIQSAGAPDLSFVPGGLAAMFVSSDGRTFRQPPEGWQPGTATEFAGSNQSLTGDFIRSGATGAAGHVAEPYLIAAIRPDVLFPAYASGSNLAEAFYAAMPFISWQTVVIGDPLCAPFRQKALDPAQIEAPVDTVSELPGFFMEHRVQSPLRGDIKIDAWKLYTRAEFLGVRGDVPRARETLERAALVDDRLIGAHMALAALAQARSDWDEAIVRFRSVLTHAPNHVTALNDLAYLLAEYKQSAAEALPLATRAFKLSKGAPIIGDTVAWTQHLLGRDTEAAPLIRQAAKQLTRNADVQLHAAVILAAVGDMAAAKTALDAAVRLNAALNERFDVRTLRVRLQELQPKPAPDVNKPTPGVKKPVPDTKKPAADTKKPAGEVKRPASGAK